MAVLTATAALANELALALRCAANRFAVCDLRFADIGIDTKLSLQAINNDLEMEFAHSRDERLSCLLIGTDFEGRIFLSEASKSDTELILILTRLGLDRHCDNGSWKLHRFENNRMVLHTDRIACSHILETAYGNDLACVCVIYIFPLVGVHPHDATNALFAPLCRVQHIRAGL